MTSRMRERKSAGITALLLTGILGGLGGSTGCLSEGFESVDAEPLDELGTGYLEEGKDKGAINQAVTAPRTTFVHLFEWKWNDVANECEQFLGPRGFEAVQVSPPNEHINHGTWWARYQPVSYKLDSRSGSRAEFASMVQRCNAVGVQVYADAVVNHTAAWNGGGVGVAGTSWSVKSHPVYGSFDYHNTCSISSYYDRYQVQNCELSGLPDLNSGSSYVQDQIAGYLNDMKSLGVSGFRIDAAKHMYHGDLAGILSRAGNPFTFLEVIGDANEPIKTGEYTYLGEVTEFGYSNHLGYEFLSGQIKNLRDIGFGKLGSGDAVVFTDNHDNQRGHGGGGNVVTYKNGALYNIANVFMLAHPYGHAKVMSSYEFTDTDAGPPAPGGCGASGWVCEHRWTAIANMVTFRGVADGQPLTNWWDNGNNRIAFGRNGKGFVAINKEGGTMNVTLQTGMAAGTYCDIVAGDFANGACTGPTITVDAGGNASFAVGSYGASAIHVGAKVGGEPPPPSGNVTVNFSCNNGYTSLGQSVYVVGSIPALGSWSPAGAVLMSPTSYPTWTKTMTLGANQSVEWKCLKRDEVDPSARVEWEPGGNNVLTTPSSGTISTTGSF